MKLEIKKCLYDINLDNFKELFQPLEAEQTQDDGQLQLMFEAC